MAWGPLVSFVDGFLMLIVVTLDQALYPIIFVSYIKVCSSLSLKAFEKPVPLSSLSLSLYSYVKAFHKPVPFSLTHTTLTGTIDLSHTQEVLELKMWEEYVLYFIYIFICCVINLFGAKAMDNASKGGAPIHLSLSHTHTQSHTRYYHTQPHTHPHTTTITHTHIHIRVNI